MFPNPKPKTELEKAIDVALYDLRNHQPESDEYGEILNRVSALHKLKEAERPSRPSADTLVLASVNLLGILMIIRHEELNVITSKALSFVRPAR